MEVGEYIRTKHSIGKFRNFGGLNNELVYFKNCDGLKCVNKDEVLKHSKNIIDLIELYDYVNNFLVFDIITYENDDKKIQLSTGVLIGNNKIENVVTHEQFESRKYEVN